MEKKWIHVLIGLGLFLLSCFMQNDGIDFKAIGIGAWMVYWWITQPIPIYITALIPLIVGFPTGLIDYNELALAYGNKMVFLFLGGFIIALAIEKWEVHRLFAQFIITKFGGSPKRLLLSFMLATAILSMWISNTATALMMLPMALSVITAIPRFRLKKRFAIALLLGIAFAANIGGTATLIGTPPNIQMAALLELEFGTTVTFFQWMRIGFPFMVLLLGITYWTLTYFFLRKIDFQLEVEQSKSLNINQKRVLLVFVLTALLWMFSAVLNAILPFQVNDTMIALLGGMSMFIIPSQEQYSLLIWEDMRRIPWGILFLFGGGLALAAILANGAVIDVVVSWFNDLRFLPVVILILLIFLVTIFATELMSNLALVSLLIPIMGKFSLAAGLPLFEVAAGIALCSSCAFMLPIATPPNAIVFSANVIQVKTMVKIGFLLNLITVILVTVLIYLVM